MAAAVRAVEAGPDLPGALRDCLALAAGQLETLDDEARRAQVRHGSKLVTARRIVRRMLEHQWEHLVEVQTRLTPS